MMYKFRGKALLTDKKQGVKKGDWVKGYLYIKEEKKRKRYFILRDIEIRLEPNFAWDYGDGPGEEDFYIHGMIEVVPETVGMQVGLIDKKGKEIYEGDIVRYDEKFMAVIVWKDGGFVFRYMDGVENISSSSWYDPLDRKITEIIGNKWDNPELLKGGE